MFGWCSAHHNCVGSYDYPYFYYNDEACHVEVLQNVNVFAPNPFIIEPVWDTLTINGVTTWDYDALPTTLSQGSEIYWETDQSVTRRGWQMCFHENTEFGGCGCEVPGLSFCLYGSERRNLQSTAAISRAIAKKREDKEASTRRELYHYDWYYDWGWYDWYYDWYYAYDWWYYDWYYDYYYEYYVIPPREDDCAYCYNSMGYDYDDPLYCLASGLTDDGAADCAQQCHNYEMPPPYCADDNEAAIATALSYGLTIESCADVEMYCGNAIAQLLCPVTCGVCSYPEYIDWSCNMCSEAEGYTYCSMFDAENVQYTMCTSDEYDGYALPCGYYLGDQPMMECPNYELYSCEECIATT